MVNYLYCSKCKLVRKGVESGRHELVCTECGNRMRIKNMAPRICAECDSRLYAPDELLDALVFPCKAEHRAEALRQAGERAEAGKAEQQANEKAEAERRAAEAASALREAQEAAARRTVQAAEEARQVVEVIRQAEALLQAEEKAANPDLKCPTCQATLRYVGGRYESCPLCGFEPDEKWVRAQQYLAGQEEKQKHEYVPVVIRHEFGNTEFVFVHPIGGHMPAGSGIVVEQNQMAVYRAAGQYIYLAQPKLYPVSLDTRTEEERLLAIAKGEQGEIMLKMDTKVIFFDQRWKRVSMKPAIRLPGSGWTVVPEVSFLMQVTDPGRLLEVAIDMADDHALATYLGDTVSRTVEDVLYGEINAAFGDAEAAASMSADDLAMNLYRRMDEEAVQEISRQINQKLLRCGAAVSQLALDTRRAACIKG